MNTLAERAADVLARHPAPALPLKELQRRVRGSGVVVAEDALLRALTVGSDRFRVLDPWRGPWAAARRGRGTGRERRSGSRRPGSDAGSTGRTGSISTPVGRRWVVARPEDPGDVGDRGALRLLRRSLLHLGWRLDDTSPRDTARWCRLVGEGARVRARVSGDSRDGRRGEEDLIVGV